tara:strand:- start:1177 stop:1557 length:381 start_codon:yes stop_codon:yes gene_type:complete
VAAYLLDILEMMCYNKGRNKKNTQGGKPMIVRNLQVSATPDTIAECYDGVGDKLYASLWCVAMAQERGEVSPVAEMDFTDLLAAFKELSEADIMPQALQDSMPAIIKELRTVLIKEDFRLDELFLD